MREVEICEFFRAIAVEDGDDYMVSFYEYMGGRWVMLGMPERWNQKDFDETYCGEVEE